MLSVASLVSFVVPVLFAPVWSRVYPVEYFAIAALVQVMPGILTGWSTLAYHTAIHTPREEAEAFNLVCLSLGLMLASVGVLTGVCLVAGDWLAVHLLGHPEIGPLMPLAPFLMLCVTVSMVMDYWMARRKCFDGLARAMVSQSLLAVLVPAIGWSRPEAANFILIGVVTGALIGCLLRLHCAGFWEHVQRGVPSFGVLRATARSHWNFPRDVLPSHVLTSFSTQAPQVAIARYFDTLTVGNFARVGTLLLVPLAVFSKPFMAVFAQEAGRAYREQGDCRPVFRRTLLKLVIVMTPLYAAIGLTGPWLYPWFYGPSWREAGLLAQPMAVFYWAAAVCSPLADVMNFGRNTKWDVAWQAVRLPVVVGALYAGARWGGVLGALWALAIANVMLYGLYLLMAYHLSVRRS